MAINFPTSIDSLTNPNTTDPQNNPSHAGQHSDANDAIEALEAKVGANGSAVTTSHDYKIAQLESGKAPLRPANTKTSLVDADEVTGNDSAASFGQIKTTWTNVKAFLKTYFDSLYATIASVPVKATGAELDTGTDDAKFATAKALKDSHNVPSVAPGNSGNILKSNGTDWVSEAPSGGGEWTELANVVLASAANSISSGTITAKKVLKVYVISPGTNSAAWIRMRFNASSAANYNFRQVVHSSSISTATTSNGTGILFGREVDAKRWFNFDISNIIDQVKMFTGHYIQEDLVSELCSGYWNNTTDQITSVAIDCTESETFDAGTRMIVYGSKD